MTLGEWRPAYTGNFIGEIPLEDRQGRTIELRHPAILYFPKSGCHFCILAEEEIRVYVIHRRSSSSVPFYAISNDGPAYVDSLNERLTAEVIVAALKRPVSALGFIKDFPMTIRTDPAGRVRHAFVGVAKEEQFDFLYSSTEPARR